VHLLRKQKKNAYGTSAGLSQRSLLVAERAGRILYNVTALSCGYVYKLCAWQRLLSVEQYVGRQLRLQTWIRARQRKSISTIKNILTLLPREAKIGILIPTVGFSGLAALLLVSLLTAFIHPAAIAYGPYGIGNEYEDEQAYYCKHLAAVSYKSGSWPVICQSSEMIAAAIKPFVFASRAVRYDGDKYDWGNCTYWAAYRRAHSGSPVPNTWGDAYAWADRAAADGYTVNHTPSPGAIMQTGWGLGHVAFIESVNTDGSWRVSEMNVVGFNVVDYRTLPASAATDYYFIH